MNNVETTIKKWQLFVLASLLPFTMLNAKVYENASDGKTNGWYIYDQWPSGVKIENVVDNEKGRVIKITGTTSNGVDFLRWNDRTHNTLKWKMKANKSSVLYVAVDTTKGFRYLCYTSRDHDLGRNPNKDSHKIRVGLGAKMKDGKWHTYQQNLQADISKHEAGNKLVKIYGIRFRGAAKFDDIETLNTNNNKPLRNIFIIGPSTVDAGGYEAKDRNGEKTGEKLEGWAEKLGLYMKKSSNLYDRARSGSTSRKYFDTGVDFNPSNNNLDGKDHFTGRDWPSVLNELQHLNQKKKGFILIQFGAGEKGDFKDNLQTYINDVNDLKEYVTPVLITNLPARHLHQAGGSKERNAKTLREVAKNNNILLLDLFTYATKKISSKYTSNDEEEYLPNVYRIPKADKIFGYVNYGKGITHNSNKGINNTHMSPNGAKIVAGWIKELACESTIADGKELCNQFK